jgi:hypothetical protein
MDGIHSPVAPVGCCWVTVAGAGQQRGTKRYLQLCKAADTMLQTKKKPCWFAAQLGHQCAPAVAQGTSVNLLCSRQDSRENGRCNCQRLLPYGNATNQMEAALVCCPAGSPVRMSCSNTRDSEPAVQPPSQHPQRSLQLPKTRNLMAMLQTKGRLCWFAAQLGHQCALAAAQGASVNLLCSRQLSKENTHHDGCNCRENIPLWQCYRPKGCCLGSLPSWVTSARVLQHNAHANLLCSRQDSTHNGRCRRMKHMIVLLILKNQREAVLVCCPAGSPVRIWCGTTRICEPAVQPPSRQRKQPLQLPKNHTLMAILQA